MFIHALVWGTSSLSTPHFLNDGLKIKQAYFAPLFRKSVLSKIDLPHYGPVAQLVERVIRIDEVRGSNPLRSTMIRKDGLEPSVRSIRVRIEGIRTEDMRSWTKGPKCSSGGRASEIFVSL